MIDKTSTDVPSAESDPVVVAIQHAVRLALLDHKRTGDPVVTCEDETVRWTAAKDLQIPDEPTESHLP